jgi:hypothetical protein
MTVKVLLAPALFLSFIAGWKPAAMFAAAFKPAPPTESRARSSPGNAAAEGLLGRSAAELKDLFAPVGTPGGMYDVYESAAPIERIAKALRARDVDPRPGAWDLQRLGAGDAFGAEGSYNRVRMALLVGGRRLAVARGSLRAEDGALTAFTLISPYPDSELRELRSGTMTIVFRVPREPR